MKYSSARSPISSVTKQTGMTKRRIREILEVSRWAPSGDNTQPWGFQIMAPNHLRIEIHLSRDEGVYNLDKKGSLMGIGALLESLAISASHQQAMITYSLGEDDNQVPEFLDVHFTIDSRVNPDPLFQWIPQRSVNRRRYRRRPLSGQEKSALESVLPDGYQVHWLEGRKRWQIACLMFANAKLRLIMPEAYSVHKKIIEWGARYSEDRIPDQALGLDAITLKLMRWALQSWQRVRFMNRYLAGTLLPRIQMDLLPGIYCSAHLTIESSHAWETTSDIINAGRALQRLWLKATSMGLQMQPEMTPVIFSGYVKRQVQFTDCADCQQLALKLEKRFSEIIPNAHKAVFVGRIGEAPGPESRSVRMPLTRLLKE